jgi:ribosomal protein S18 acetylase RimI-like enzyme
VNVSGGLRFSRPSPVLARAQASWIAAMDPWRALGYGSPALGRYLARKAGARRVWIARAGKGAEPSALAVADDGFLLGGFIALLAVRPVVKGRGIGRALVERIAAEVFATRRWLFVSCDGNNRAALRFYRKLGFSRVGRLPDLVRSGNVEILLRKPAPPGPGPDGRDAPPVGQNPPSAVRSPGTEFPAGAVRVGYHRGRS